MNYLLDTCVVSDTVAKQPNTNVAQWLQSQDSQTVYLSVITIGEIRKGIERLPDSKRKMSLEQWLQDILLKRFGNRILPITVDVMLEWGHLTGKLEQQGKKMSAMDSLIAATAIHNHLGLVTRNEDDFKDAGITLINPWK